MMTPVMIIDEYLTYLAEGRRLSRNTVRLRGVYVRQVACDLDLRTATTAQLRTWIMRRQEWAPETVNAVTATLRSFYGWAVEMGHVPTNPAKPMRPLRIPPPTPKIATPEQIAAGLSSESLHMQAITMLGAECGLRVHEIAKLHTRDRAGEWITVVGKGGQTRTVHASPELRVVLDALEQAQGAGWYFRSPAGGHLTAEAVRQRISRTMGTNPHSLRHRAATTVYRGTGNNLRVTQVFLGHSNPQTTARYVHVERDDLIAASYASRIAA